MTTVLSVSAGDKYYVSNESLAALEKEESSLETYARYLFTIAEDFARSREVEQKDALFSLFLEINKIRIMLTALADMLVVEPALDAGVHESYEFYLIQIATKRGFVMEIVSQIDETVQASREAALTLGDEFARRKFSDCANRLNKVKNVLDDVQRQLYEKLP